MSSGVIAWSGAVYVAAFWVFMSTRIYVMWRQGVSVLTIDTGFLGSTWETSAGNTVTP